MKSLILALLLVSTIYATEKLIFEDDFEFLDLKKWQHELTLGGGGNWEFEWYVNNRSNSYTKNGVLYIKPTLTEDAIGTDGLRNQRLDNWGGTPGDICTSNQFYGCERSPGLSGNINNPIRSARIRTSKSFSFTYGRVEVKAKLPKGDWLWPAIWLLPLDNFYGNWPASGEIDILESRGNDPSYPAGGSDTFGSTLHWGTDWSQNQYAKTHKTYKHTESLSNDFHTYGLYWDSKTLYTYFDSPSNVILSVDFTQESFFQRGQFPATFDNPWVGEPNSAPFNKDFYLIINLAIGGTNGYFPDGQAAKPWADADPHSTNSFYNNKGQWQPTWQGESSALQVDSIKVWSFDSAEEMNQTQ